MPVTPPALRWTSSDLALLPGDGKRYEIIDGDLYVSRQPHLYHQAICVELSSVLHRWSRETRQGLTLYAPGVVFADDDVVPDLAWIGSERLGAAVDANGHLRAAPDLVVEVLSPGTANERRDREPKRKLYARRGVLEYWIVDWRLRQVEVYHRVDADLALAHTLRESDTLQSPLLPSFSYPLTQLFADLPPGS